MEAPIPSEMEAPGLGLPPQKKIGGAAAEMPTFSIKFLDSYIVYVFKTTSAD